MGGDGTTFGSGTPSRRQVLAAGMAAGGALLVGGRSRADASPLGAAASRGGLAAPFTLGVASGDPRPDGIVLWTRLAPRPLDGGGMPDRPLAVEWEIARDERMRQVVRRGVELAVPGSAHSVHAEVSGLRPASWYFYRFRAAGHLSPVGRTRTAPDPRKRTERLRFAFASCQNFQDGLWPAYRAMAEDDLDLVVHLGDYIYEGGVNAGAIRQHNSPEIMTLADYRNRHALYKSDPALRNVHAAFAWLPTFDDHEVENNYADAIPENPADAPGFLARRAAAYQAYWEHLPLRRAQRPHGPNMRLFRRSTHGDLVEFQVLDTRQFRTDQPCGDGLKARCPAALDPAATMTGPEQERWLLDGLDRSRARWNVIAQQVMFGQIDFLAGPGSVFNMDQWDGYVAARNRILGFLHHRRPSNPVVLSGDIHSSWADDLKADFDDPASATVGSELVGTSISSSFSPASIPPILAALPESPHIKFFDGAHRGYVRCDVDRARWRADFRAASSVTVADAPVTTLASFEITSGAPGLAAV
jgi:alkaline phosphatase D